MGWMNVDHPEHEGWPVALVIDKERGLCHSAYFRELAYPADEAPRSTVDAVQAGCDCGWRSSRILVPTIGRGAVQWHPFSATVSEPLEEQLLALWRAHVDGVNERADVAAGTARDSAIALLIGYGCSAGGEHDCCEVGKWGKEADWCMRCRVLLRLGHGAVATAKRIVEARSR